MIRDEFLPESKVQRFVSAGPLEEQDHIRLHNVQLLFKNRPNHHSIPPSQRHWLKNLSLQFDALGVYETLVRDSAGNAFGPNKGLAIKLLSFLHYGLENPDLGISDHIVTQIVGSADMQVLKEAVYRLIEFDRERNQAIKQRYTWLKRVETLVRGPALEKQIKRYSPLEGSNFMVHLLDAQFYSSIARTDEEEVISCELHNPMYLMEELEIRKRFDRAVSSLSPPIQKYGATEAKAAIEVMYEFVQKNRELSEQMRHVLGNNQDYPIIQFYIGLLYEYENLKIAQLQIQDFFSTFNVEEVASREGFIQCVDVVAEAVNAIFLPLHQRDFSFSGDEGFVMTEPGIPFDDDIIPIRDVLIFLRNKVFEHPLAWRQEKLKELLNVDTSSTVEIFEHLKVELEREVTRRIICRLGLISHLIRGEEGWEEKLSSFKERYLSKVPLLKEPGKDQSSLATTTEQLQSQKIWQEHPLPTFQSLRRYFFYPLLSLSTVLEVGPDEIEQQRQSVLKSLKGSSKEDITHTWDDLNRCLDQIRFFVGFPLHRNTLSAKLSIDIKKCLQAKRIINQFFQILRSLFEHPSQSGGYLSKVNTSYQRVLEHFYLDLRNQRNFQTHDLWRKEDINRLTNNMIRAITIFEHAFGPHSSQEKRSIDTPVYQLLEGIRSNSLTSDQVRYVLTSDVDANFSDDRERTLLHHAVCNQNSDVARTLLELGANLHRMDYKGETSLHYAVAGGDEDLTKLLLTFGALPDTKNSEGHDAVDIVLERFTGEDEKAAKRNFVLLLKKYDSWNRGDETDALHEAVRTYDVSRLEALLIEEGHLPFLYDREGRLPLALAMEEFVPTEWSLEIGGKLLKNGAFVDQQEFNSGNRALYYATSDRSSRKAKFLLDEQSKPEVFGEESPLSQAAFVSEEILQLLLNAGGLPTSVDILGKPVLLSLMNSHSRLYGNVKILLDAGADPNSCDKYGTVLHNVVERNGSPEAALLLLEAGAAPFVKGWKGLYAGKTPLEVTQDHLLPMIQQWLGTDRARKIYFTLEEIMSRLSWSDLWKKRLLGLYTGDNTQITEETQIAGFDGEKTYFLNLASPGHPISKMKPREMSRVLLDNLVKKMKKLISEDLLIGADGLVDDHNVLRNAKERSRLISFVARLKRTEYALEVYRKSCIEDYNLDSGLSNQEMANNLRLLPKFKINFKKLLGRKKTQENDLVTFLLKNKSFLRRFIENSVSTGSWLGSVKGGTGILRAYARLTNTNLIFWSSTLEPGKWDLKTEMHKTSSNLHFMYPTEYGIQHLVLLEDSSVE